MDKFIVKDFRKLLKGKDTAVIRINGSFCDVDLFDRNDQTMTRTKYSTDFDNGQHGDWFLYVDRLFVLNLLPASAEVKFYFQDESNQFQKEKGETTAALYCVAYTRKNGHLNKRAEILIDTQTHTADNSAKYVKSF